MYIHGWGTTMAFVDFNCSLTSVLVGKDAMFH